MMTPEAYPWHAEPLDGFVERMFAGRLHHALLLEAPSGTGVRALAERLAAAMLCAAPTGSGACNECKSCQLFRADTHPDMFWVEPEEAGKQIRIDRIRELAEFVARTASVSRRKAVLLDPADAMNMSSANSLLKSLEEPSPGTHLILVTQSAGRLLPTIRSRCEQLHLGIPPREESLAWMAQQMDPDQASALLDVAAGRPLAALGLAGQGGLALLTGVAAAFDTCAQPAAIIPPVVAALGAYELREVLDVMALVLLDFQRAELSRDQRLARLSCNQEIYARMSGCCDDGHLARTLAAVQQAIREAASTANPNRALLLESILIGWQTGCAGKKRG